MKKVYYVSAGSDTIFSGIDRKIEDQLSVLKEYFECSHIIVRKVHVSLARKILERLPLGSIKRAYNDALASINEDADYIYIRKTLFDKGFISFVRDIAFKCCRAKIIMEFPTYPYYRELIRQFELVPFYFKDLIWRKKLRKYVDVATTYSDDNNIFGIPTIQIMNGIVVDKIWLPERSKHIEKTDAAINLLAVAQMLPAHGYERVINGIANYYQNKGKRNVMFHLVGDGPECEIYRKITRKYGLEDNVIFYGLKTGMELDNIYSKADIGLGSFGGYKNHLYVSSALKIREYLAHGLPIVSGMKEDVFLKNKPEFYLELPNSPEDIDIERIVCFIDGIRRKYKRDELREIIREYAKKTVDMRITMKPIVDYMNGSE